MLACPAYSFTMRAGDAVRQSMVCRESDVTPHVTVDGKALLIVDLTEHRKTATFYGAGTVVRFSEIGRRVAVLAITTLPQARVHIWLTL
jgi:hypothetical protein